MFANSTASWRSVFLLLCTASLLLLTAWSSWAGPAQVTEKDSSDRDLQELESLFSSGSIPVGAEAPLNISSPIQGPMDALYSMPFAELFKNISIFMEFDLLLGQDPFTAYHNMTSGQSASQPGEKIKRVIS